LCHRDHRWDEMTYTLYEMANEA